MGDVDVSNSHRVKVHNTEDILTFRDKLFLPASEWNYWMRGNMQEIIPGLFLGPYSSALEQCKNHLLRQGITHIVCVRSGSESHFIHPQFNGNFTYLTLDIADNEIENILRFFARVNSFISKALQGKGKVLVHGNAGISRSATLVLAYVMESLNLSNTEALKLVKEKRGCINPNDGFAAQLYEYEVIYKTEKFFANKGGSSKVNHSCLKRKHVESEKMDTKHDKVEPSFSTINFRNGTVSSKKLTNSVSRIFLKHKS